MPHQHTILVVEDDPHFRQTLIWALEAHHQQVLAVSTGRQALSVLKNAVSPCGILLDVTLPDMPITQLVREIRLLGPAIPLILMSGNSFSEVQAHVAVDAVHFLAKPFDLATLYAVLNRLVRM